MNKKKFTYLMMFLLVLSNLVLLYFVAQRPRGSFDPNKPKKFFIERLDFDKNQITAYEKLIEKHRKEIRKNDVKIRELKNDLYLLLLDENKFKADSLTQEIGKVQTNIENIHFNHFLDIKALCKTNQIDKFNLIANDMMEIFNHNKKPK